MQSIKGCRKNMHSSNYKPPSCNLQSHDGVSSQIEGDGNISNLIIITIVQPRRQRRWVASVSVWLTPWLTDVQTDWRTEGLKDSPGVGLTTCLLPRRHLAMTLPCNCTPLLGSGSGGLHSGDGGRLLGVCHVVYWPVCVLPVHIWIFVAILMNFQPGYCYGSWVRVKSTAYQAARHARSYRMRQWVRVWVLNANVSRAERSHCVSRYYGHFVARWCARLFGYLAKSSNLFAIVVDAAIVWKSICVVILTDHFLCHSHYTMKVEL